MRANLADPITLGDLLRVCDCSRSSLFAAFRNARGFSPMEFLADQRLNATRRRLRKPTGSDTVSSVAADCGFVHLGRFAQAYRRRCGEAPSDTLRQARRKQP